MPPEEFCMLAIQKVRATIPPPLTYTVKEIAYYLALSQATGPRYFAFPTCQAKHP
jgi:hypothetical protein